MTSLAPLHTELPDDGDGWSDGLPDTPPNRRRSFGDGREHGRTWWRPSLTPRPDRPTLRERLVPPVAREPWWLAWGLPILVTVFGGIMRFWNLGKPNTVVFDETYYAKDAWTTIHFGHARGWLAAPDGSGMALDDKQIIANSHLWHGLLDGAKPGYEVHPPVGKWMIGAGEAIFGFNPFGWRFVAAVCGTLAILMIARIARRLFRSTLIGCLAGLLMAVDGMEFVMSRIALLDIFVMFWTLAAFGCLLVDRDWMRTRLIEWRESLPSTPLPMDSRGPRLGFRPWRFAAAVCLGLDMGTKWSGLWIIVVFLAMSLLWDHGAFRTVGIRKHWRTFFRKTFWQSGLLGLFTVVVYASTWSGWFLTKDGYYRQTFVPRNGYQDGFYQRGDVTEGPHVQFLAALHSFWNYHMKTFGFHTNLETPHAYMSNPWSWLIMGRPTDYYYESPTRGQSGCTVKLCSQQVLALGTPTLWWFATLALVWCVWRWLARRDWRAGAILGGMIAAWAFWLHYQHRTIFTFYAVAFEPFMVLAAAYLIGAILGREAAPGSRRQWGAIGAGVITVIILLTFMYFYPIYSAKTITNEQWQGRMWWPSWI